MSLLFSRKIPPIKKKISREKDKDLPVKKNLLVTLHIIAVVIMPVILEVCELTIQFAIYVDVIPFILLQFLFRTRTLTKSWE